MAVELGEVMHMVAAASNVQDTHTLQRTAGPFISKFCEEALLTNNVYKLVPGKTVGFNVIKKHQNPGMLH